MTAQSRRPRRSTGRRRYGRRLLSWPTSDTGLQLGRSTSAASRPPRVRRGPRCRWRGYADVSPKFSAQTASVASGLGSWPSPVELPIRSDVVGTSPRGILGFSVSLRASSHCQFAAVAPRWRHQAGGTARAWDGHPLGHLDRPHPYLFT